MISKIKLQTVMIEDKLCRIIAKCYEQNINKIICKSNKKISAKLRYTVPSKPSNLKLVTDLISSFLTCNFIGFRTKTNLELDNECNIHNSNLADSNFVFFGIAAQSDAKSHMKIFYKSEEDWIFSGTLTINYRVCALILTHQNVVSIYGTKLQPLMRDVSNDIVNSIRHVTSIKGVSGMRKAGEIKDDEMERIMVA